MKAIPMIGKRYGKLVVLERSGVEKLTGTVIYKCQCDCGKVKNINGKNLRNRQTQSCGCTKEQKGSYKTQEEGTYRNKYSVLARKCEPRFNDSPPTFDEWKAIVTQNCAYCDSPPPLITAARYKIPVPCIGIDRINNDKGYTPANMLPCCKKCNFDKRHKTVREFESEFFPNGFLGTAKNLFRQKK